MLARFSPILLFLFLYSCSPYQFAEDHVRRAVQRDGLHFRTAKLDGYTISYWDSENDKPALFLVQGLGAEAEFHWYKQLHALKNYRVIMPDLLYFGDSKPDKDDHSVANQVKAMQLLIRKLDLKKYDLCGFSYGGLVAAELARSEPEKIRKLVIFDAPVKYFVREDMQPMLEKFGLREPSQLLVPEDAKSMKALTAVIYKHPPHLPMAFHKSFQEHMYGESAEDYRKILRQLEKERSVFESRNYPFEFPILLVWGEDDKMVPSSVGKALQHYFGSNCELAIIPETGHVPNLEAPRAFNRVLLKFLEKTSSQEQPIGKSMQ